MHIKYLFFFKSILFAFDFSLKVQPKKEKKKKFGLRVKQSQCAECSKVENKQFVLIIFFFRVFLSSPIPAILNP